MREQLRNRLKEVWPGWTSWPRQEREAVELTREHKPDIVFLDIRIPGLTGVEAAKQVRSCPKTTVAGADRLHHGLRPVCRRGLRARCGGLRAQARRARPRLQLTVARIKRLAQRSAARLQRQRPGAAAATAAQALGPDEPGRQAQLSAVDPGQRGPGHPNDSGRGRALLHQRREVHPRPDRQARSPDPQADQGTGRRAGPPNSSGRSTAPPWSTPAPSTASPRLPRAARWWA